MKETRFRAWVKNEPNRGMHYPKCIQLVENGEVDTLWTDTHKLTHFVDDMILMQFTGLQDRDGKEIYEGDIVEYTPNALIFPNVTELYKAVWERNGFVFKKTEDAHVAYMSESKLRVVGNIYEHSDLLQ